MPGKKDIFKRMILIGGAPRSGTTFAARSLNSHPKIVTAVDDHVYECWGLYYYGTRSGLIQEIRCREMSRKDAIDILKNHLFSGNKLKCAAPSEKTAGYPFSPLPVRPDAATVSMDSQLVRHSLPLERFGKEWYLCLKSPEISYVLPQLANLFEKTKFVLVYRPIIEIAESMYRLGNIVKQVSVFYKRWKHETNSSGELIPPPGIPTEWHKLWQIVSDFQRCVINAASYLRAELEGAAEIPAGRVFVYDHSQLQKHPAQVFARLADFLGVDPSGFKKAVTELRGTTPAIGSDLRYEYEIIARQLNLKGLVTRLESLNALNQE